MTPVSGGYAVDVPTINVSDSARREHATVWSTFRAFAVTLRRFFTSLFKGDIPTINYPEQSRPYSERFRGTHILTVRDDGSLKCVRSEEHTSELQSRGHLVCRLLLEKKKNIQHST